MTRSRRAAAAATAVVVALGMTACSSPRPRSAPDVVLITIDTLRADALGAYGSAAHATPTLDAIAASGVRFADAVATAPLTLPSHTSILTATTPLTHGVHDNVGYVVGATLPTVAERFAAAGYDTAAFVSGFPLQRHFGLARGFSLYDDHFTQGAEAGNSVPVERPANETAASAIEWIEKPGPADRKLFAWFHFFDPHAPYEAPEPFGSRFHTQPYEGEVSFVDAQIGVLLDRLHRARPDREILLAVTADHGEALGDHREPTHGLFIYDSTLRVPWLIAGPGIAAGSVVTTGVSLIDLAPTLLDLAGLPPLPHPDGVSLRPWLSRAGAQGQPRGVYAESLFGSLCCGWAPLQAWREGGWMFIDAPRPELYDLAADPGERRNVAADHADDIGRLRRALDEVRAANQPGKRESSTAETRDRLRSLGYVSGGAASRRSLRDPKDMIEVSTWIGQAIELERRDPVRAAALLEKALTGDPANLMVRRHLAAVLMGQGRFQDAAAQLSVLAADGDQSDETALLSADVAIARGNLQEAQRRLDALYADHRDDLTIAFKLGLVVARLGLPGEAIPLFEAVVKAEPANVDAVVDLGHALLGAGRTADAGTRFTHAISLGADTPLAWNGLGLVKLRSGDPQGAAAAFQHSLNLDANQPDISTALRHIRGR